MLKSQGCVQPPGNNGLVFTCPADKPLALTTCNKFKDARNTIVCNVASASAPSATPAATLGGMGCKSFLGRANQYLCEDNKAWQLCVDYVKANKADLCMSPTRGPYADEENTISMLK